MLLLSRMVYKLSNGNANDGIGLEERSANQCGKEVVLMLLFLA
jgi:hypothetical protein